MTNSLSTSLTDYTPINMDMRETHGETDKKFKLESSAAKVRRRRKCHLS